MNNTYLAIIGATAGLINLIGLIPYMLDILRHKTKPERTMWWIYTVLFALLFAAQLNAGAVWLLLVTGVYVVTSALIAILSLKYGYGRFHKRDAVSLIIAGAGLVIWLITNQPLVAIIMVIIVDFAGFWLTLVKTWHAPHTETLIAWQLACLAGVVSIFSIGSWKLELIIYPIYTIIGTALISWLIMHRRRTVTEDAADF